MANLATSAVTLSDSWPVHGPGKHYTMRQFSLVLTGQGGATNKILASVLGFSQLENAEPGILDTNAGVVIAYPSLDRSFLILKASATNEPFDYTGTLVIRIGGQ